MLQVGNKNSALFNERLGKVTKDGQKLGCEVVQGLMGECLKTSVFGWTAPAPDAADTNMEA